MSKIYYQITQVEPPENLRLDDLKDYLRLDLDYEDDDEQLEDFLLSSLEYVERYTGQNLFARTVIGKIGRYMDPIILKYENVEIVKLICAGRDLDKDSYQYNLDTNQLYLNDAFYAQPIDIHIYTGKVVLKQLLKTIIVKLAAKYYESEMPSAEFLREVHQQLQPMRIINI